MFKKALFAFSILSIAGTAAAADITNPFYIARKGQVGSVTMLARERGQFKSKYEFTTEQRVVAVEELQLGLTDSVAVIGSFGNTWNKWKALWSGDDAPHSHHDDENIQWSAGLAWNILQGPTNWQVSAKYGQDRQKNFSGEYKYIATETKLGYRFKKALPYISGAIEIPVAQKSGVKGVAGDKLIYNTKAGVYQGQCEVWSLDTGVRLKYDENQESSVITAEAEASYYLTPTTTVGIFGTYALDGKSKYSTDVREKSIGARLYF